MNNISTKPIHDNSLAGQRQRLLAYLKNNRSITTLEDKPHRVVEYVLIPKRMEANDV